MKISDFVEFELQDLRDKCNFSDEELHFFNHRARNKSITEITFDMKISPSKANDLSKKVKRKIIKVL